MARSFAVASTEYLEYGGAVVAAEPFAMACWCYPNAANTRCLMGIGDTDGSSFHGIYMWDINPDAVAAYSIQSSGSAATSTTSPSISAWNHVCGVFAAAADRRVLLNGGGKGTETTSRTVTGLDNVTIGCRKYNNAVTHHFDGLVAEAAIWNLSNWTGATAAAKADEFERVVVPSLAKGFSPLHFRLGLVAYWPLGGLLSDDNAANDASGDRDIVGGYNMSPYNTPGVADHLGIIYPRRAAAEPSGFKPYWLRRATQIIGGGVA